MHYNNNNNNNKAVVTAFVGNSNIIENNCNVLLALAAKNKSANTERQETVFE